MRPMKKAGILVGFALLVVGLYFIQVQKEKISLADIQEDQIEAGQLVSVSTSGVTVEIEDDIATELTGEARYNAIIEHLAECGVESIDLPYEIEEWKISSKSGVKDDDMIVSYKFSDETSGVNSMEISIHCENKNKSQEYSTSVTPEVTSGAELNYLQIYDYYINQLTGKNYDDNTNKLSRILYRDMGTNYLVFKVQANIGETNVNDFLQSKSDGRSIFYGDIYMIASSTVYREESRYTSIINQLSECNIESLDLYYEIENRKLYVYGSPQSSYGLDHGPVEFVKGVSYSVPQDSINLLGIESLSLNIVCEPKTIVYHKNALVNNVTDKIMAHSNLRDFGSTEYYQSIGVDRLGYVENRKIYKIVYRDLGSKYIVVYLWASTSIDNADEILANNILQSHPVWLQIDQIAKSIEYINN